MGTEPTKSAPKVVDAASAATAAPSATAQMPAGDAKREAMKKDLEALQQMRADFETKYGPEIGAIDPAKLDPKNVDNEIAVWSDNPQRDGSVVQDAQPEYQYYWAEAQGARSNPSTEVYNLKTLGWEVVTGSMPEERRRKEVDGTRRWGTTILMRIRKERAAVLQAAERRKVISRTTGMNERLLEQAEKAGIKIHDLTSDKTPEYIRRNALAQQAAGAAAAQTYAANMRQVGRGARTLASELANRKLEQALRAGTLPGLPASNS